MKIFPNQKTAILSIIADTTKHRMVLDKTLQIYFKQNPKWGSKDRKTVAQCSYDIVRNYPLLKQLTPVNQDIVETYIGIIAQYSSIDLEQIAVNHPNIDFATLYSIPEDFMSTCNAEMTNAVVELKAMHRIADIYLRVNVSQIDFDVFCEILTSEAIDYEPIRTYTIGSRTFSLHAIKLNQKLNPNSEFYIRNQVYFEFQDLGSQIISLMHPVPEKATILESCAGNGGKSTHILDIMPSSSQLISMDIEEKKLDHLKVRVSRLFNKKIKTELAIADQIDKYVQKIDVLYMDLPCTGSGTIKRQPDLKYRITNEDVLKKALLQRQIIENFDACLKPQGTLIYSTCSIFKSENEDQVEWLVSRGYTLLDSLHLLPSQYEGDGFYVAVLKKN